MLIEIQGVAVIGVSPDFNQRCTFEHFMTARIASESVQAIASCDLMKPDELLTREGDYRDIFTTRRTFMSAPLGMVYRVPADRPGGWAPFEFAADDVVDIFDRSQNAFA